MKNDHHTYIHTHYFYISYAHTHETQLYTHKIRVHLDFYILNRKHFLLFSLYLSLAFTRSYTYIQCTNEHSFIHTNTRLVSGIHTLNMHHNPGCLTLSACWSRLLVKILNTSLAKYHLGRGNDGCTWHHNTYWYHLQGFTRNRHERCIVYLTCGILRHMLPEVCRCSILRSRIHCFGCGFLFMKVPISPK